MAPTARVTVSGIVEPDQPGDRTGLVTVHCRLAGYGEIGDRLEASTGPASIAARSARPALPCFATICRSSAAALAVPPAREDA